VVTDAFRRSDAYLAASRAGDLAVLDPDVVFHADQAAVRMGGQLLES
jgi:hypothetical protein